MVAAQVTTQDVAQDVAQVLIDGKWRAADAEGDFHAENPAKGEPLPLAFPISRWSDCDAALTAASKAAAHVSVAAEPARKRVSGQHPGESGSRCQDNHGLT